jgi:hypothetical protein
MFFFLGEDSVPGELTELNMLLPVPLSSPFSLFADAVSNCDTAFGALNRLTSLDSVAVLSSGFFELCAMPDTSLKMEAFLFKSFDLSASFFEISPSVNGFFMTTALPVLESVASDVLLAPNENMAAEADFIVLGFPKENVGTLFAADLSVGAVFAIESPNENVVTLFVDRLSLLVLADETVLDDAADDVLLRPNVKVGFVATAESTTDVTASTPNKTFVDVLLSLSNFVEFETLAGAPSTLSTPNKNLAFSTPLVFSVPVVVSLAGAPKLHDVLAGLAAFFHTSFELEGAETVDTLVPGFGEVHATHLVSALALRTKHSLHSHVSEVGLNLSPQPLVRLGVAESTLSVGGFGRSIGFLFSTRILVQLEHRSPVLSSKQTLHVHGGVADFGGLLVDDFGEAKSHFDNVGFTRNCGIGAGADFVGQAFSYRDSFN